MTPEPRNESDYSQRQTMAARRVLVDVGQVLASYVDCLVVRRTLCDYGLLPWPIFW